MSLHSKDTFVHCAVCLPCMMHQWPLEVHPRHPDHTSSCQPPPWPALLRRWESGLDWWQPSPVQRSSRPSEHFSATQLLGLHSNTFLRHSKLSRNLFAASSKFPQILGKMYGRCSWPLHCWKLIQGGSSHTLLYSEDHSKIGIVAQTNTNNTHNYHWTITWELRVLENI